MAKVKIYSTTTCPWCVRAKQWFKEQGIEFEDINVQKDEAAAKEMVEKSGQTGVPVIDINGKIIVGFNLEAIKQALEGEAPTEEKEGEPKEVAKDE